MNPTRLFLVGAMALATLACSAIPFLASTRGTLPAATSAFPTLPRVTQTLRLTPTLAAATEGPTETPALPPLPTTTFDSTAYADPHGLFRLQYPHGWLVTQAENGTTSFCEADTLESPCFTVQLREASGDVQAFADEILIGLESSVSDYFAAPPFQSTTSDNRPIIWNYVEYTYHDVTRAGQLAFVVNRRQGYYISAMALTDRYQEMEGLLTEMILGMRFGG